MDAPCSEEQPCEPRQSPISDDVRARGRVQLSKCHLVAPPMWQRLAARGHDALMLVPLAVLTLLLALFFKYVGDNFLSYSSVPLLDFGDLRAVAGWFCMAGLFVPMLPVAVLVNEVVSARKKGQTLGKAKAQLCVLGLRDNRVLRGSTIALPTVSRLMVRAVVLYVPPAVMLFGWSFPGLSGHTAVSFVVLGAMPAYVLALVVSALVTAQRRGLHDLVAGTMVVDVTALPAGYECSAMGRGTDRRGHPRWRSGHRSPRRRR